MSSIRKNSTATKWYKNPAIIASVISGFSLILVALIGGLFKNCGTSGSKETPVEIHQTMTGNHGTLIGKNDGVLNINKQADNAPPDSITAKK